MSTATGVVFFLAPVIGRYGGLSSDLSLILDLVAREVARKHTAFYNIGFSEAKALFRQKLARQWGHAIARGWATLLLDRLRDFVVVVPLTPEDKRRFPARRAQRLNNGALSSMQKQTQKRLKSGFKMIS